MKSFLIKDILDLERAETVTTLKNKREDSPLQKGRSDDRCQDLLRKRKHGKAKGSDGTNSICSANKSAGWRKKFSLVQRRLLEESFKTQKYLSVKQRDRLAREIQLSSEQVKTWYQNRRTRWRKLHMAKINEYFWMNMKSWQKTNHSPKKAPDGKTSKLIIREMT